MPKPWYEPYRYSDGRRFAREEQRDTLIEFMTGLVSYIILFGMIYLILVLCFSL